MTFPLVSFRVHLLVITLIFVVSLAGVAYFTDVRVREAAERSRIDQLHLHNSKTAMERLFWVLLELKDGIHEFAADPTPGKGDSLMARAAALQRSVSELKEHAGAAPEHAEFVGLLQRLEPQARQLGRASRRLIEELSSPQKRFPAMPLMVDGMMPLRDGIDLALQLALDESLEAVGEPAQDRVRELLHQLRYNWSQLLSLTRAFIANRSGVFGPPAQAMEGNLSRRELYIDRIGGLLERFEALEDEGLLGLQQSASLGEIKRQWPLFERTFQQVSAIYYSDDWRRDGPLLREQVDPAMNRVWSLMHAMQEHLHEAAQENMRSAVDTAETISGFLWLFLGAVLVTASILFLMFERFIRLPMLKVATALDAEARGEEGVRVPEVNALETRLLTQAFGNMREQVGSRQRRLQSILDNTTDGIITIDERGEVENFNRAAERLFGYRAAEIIGNNVSLLMPEPDRSRHDGYLERYRSSGQKRVLGQEFERTACRKDGGLFPVSIKTNELYLEGRRLFTAIVADISERRLLMERLQTLAERDPLTGLYNRRYFYEELARIQERVRRGGMSCALLFMDLDNFKYVNDTMGHAAGDQVLRDVTDLLKRRARAGDLLARLGGDEFAVLLYEAGPQSAWGVAEDFRKQLANYRFHHEGQAADVGCSIGLAMLSAAAPDKPSPLEQADIACNLAKQGGRNRVRLYGAENQQDADAMSKEMGWARAIKDAVDTGRFRLIPQPVLDLHSRQVSRHQIEVRMLSVEGREILPVEYAKHAQRFGLTKEIDRWVANEAIALLAERRQSDPHSRFSIRLSCQSFREGTIIDILERGILDHGVPPDALIIEFLEAEVVQNLIQIKPCAERLRHSGFTLSVAGVGCGSLQFGYLKPLPVELTRIDPSLIRSMEKDNLTKVLVQSIINMLHVLYKNVGAEGVDSVVVARALADMGLDCLQGAVVNEKGMIDSED